MRLQISPWERLMTRQSGVIGVEVISVGFKAEHIEFL